MIFIFPSCLYIRQKRDTGYFDSLKVDSRNVTNSMTFATKSSNQNFIIFLNKIQATISGYKRLSLFAILGELNPDTFPDGRIWLFGFNPYFFKHNSLGTRSVSKRVGLQGCAQMGFLVLLPCCFRACWWLQSFLAKTRMLAHPTSTMGLKERPSCLILTQARRVLGC